MEVNKSRFDFLLPAELLKEDPNSMNEEELGEFRSALMKHLENRKKKPTGPRAKGWGGFFYSDTVALEIEGMLQRIQSVKEGRQRKKGVLRLPKMPRVFRFLRGKR